MQQKKHLSFWQIFNMSFGFLGIQFGWSLQMGNMGPIYEYLHVEEGNFAYLFLAGPLTGLLVQPIIGYLSDHTWSPRWGRRRPYFLIGAILSSVCLLLMPNSSAVDKLNEDQRTFGFSMQSFMIGAGSVVASALPWLMSHYTHLSSKGSDAQPIPDTVKYSFYLGAVVFILSVLYTVFTTSEEPPSAGQQKEMDAGKGVMSVFAEIGESIADMPAAMKQLAIVQFFTWAGLFLMWPYYSVAVARNVFHATDPASPEYTRGIEFAGLTLSYYNLVTFCFAFFISLLVDKLGKKMTHALCLACGGIGLISVGMVTDPNMLFACMTGVGIAWASILSMPYAILAGNVDEKKMGLYIGIFNMFIVIPQLVSLVAFGVLMQTVLHNDRLMAVMCAGGLLLLAAGSTFFISDRHNS
jgi:maltose/moltooligosaccharide transporter